MTSLIVPTLRYRDAPAMISWLGRAFGFAPHLVVDDGRGGITHAQLVLGGGMIMLGSVRDDDFGALQAPPDSLGGTTQGCYVVVADADEVHESAVAAGATVVLPIKDNDYGGRGFSCLDPEGHLWSVGSYDPWAHTA